MKLKDIIEGLKNNTLEVESNSHWYNKEDLINYLHNIQYTHSHMYKINSELFNDDAIKITYLNDNNPEKDFKNGEEIYFQLTMISSTIRCFACDKELIPIMGDNKLILCERVFYCNRHFRLHENLNKQCELKGLIESQKLISTINVPSGELIFTDFFRTESLNERPDVYTNEDYCDINSLKGRNKLMQYLATQNVGYGQLSNMCYGVFVKDDKTEIILANIYYYDEDDYEYHTEIDGFTYLGSVCCDMWRWQCADKLVLDAVNDPYEEKEHIVADVNIGNWQIEHFFDFIRDCDNDKINIYTHLKLIP